MEKLIARSREIDGKIMSSYLERNALRALNLVNDLMSNHEKMESSLLNKTRTLYDGFQVAVMTEETLSAAKSFIQQLHSIQSAILSPESSAVKRTEALMNDAEIFG